MTYSLASKVGELLKDGNAVKILEQHVPGISTNPMLGLAKGMTLETLLALPQAKKAGITKAMVMQVLAEINGTKTS